MSKKEDSLKDNLNIGKNTQWDSPQKSPSAGSTIRKPPTGLDPNKKLKR